MRDDNRTTQPQDPDKNKARETRDLDANKGDRTAPGAPKGDQKAPTPGR